MIKYRTVSETSKNGFDQTVNVYLHRGWVISGSLCVTKSLFGKTRYSQALTQDKQVTTTLRGADIPPAPNSSTMNFTKMNSTK